MTQGSILGPLLFLLFINDIANVSSIFFQILFADDTSIFISGCDVNDLVKEMNKELDKLLV